jgi:hypothetical protein
MKWHIVNDFAIWYVELLINCFTSCFCFFVSFNVCSWMCSNGDVCTYVQCMCSKCVYDNACFEDVALEIKSINEEFKCLLFLCV